MVAERPIAEVGNSEYVSHEKTQIGHKDIPFSKINSLVISINSREYKKVAGMLSSKETILGLI
jgi:hypothetical protein